MTELQKSSLQELLAQLEVDPKTGLSRSEAKKRQEQYGLNELDTQEAISAWKILLRQLQDLMVVILLVATVVAIISWWVEGGEGAPWDALVILAIVVANTALGFAQEYRAEKTIEELQRSTAARARVVRDGTAFNLEQSQLVPGDIVLLGEGDRIPADGVLLEAAHFQVDESLLTGESIPVTKVASGGDRELFAGTVVTAGSARGLVVRTGTNTELGQIAGSLSSTVPEATPLQQRLNELGKKIGWGVLILSVIIGLTVLLVEGKSDLSTLTRVAMFSVALAVAAVPEGLPAVLTVSLSSGARRLAARQAVARKMAAVETLGSVTTIVTDKTGTLTHNQMTVRALFCEGQKLKVTGNGYQPSGQLLDSEGNPAALSPAVLSLIRCGALANGASLETDSRGEIRAVGDPMDAGLLVLASKAEVDWEKLRQQSDQLSEAPFSSERARVSHLRQGPDGPTLYLKGAPSAVLPLCSELPGGQPLEQSARDRLESCESEFAGRALRTLCFAQLRKANPDQPPAEQEKGLTLLGLAAFEDPPRAEVADALSRCRTASIRVVMCTGDHPTTAAAVARQVGLQDGDREAITGAQISQLGATKFEDEVRERNIFARLNPQQKLEIVSSMIRDGQVVAMTGDGVNDAPALKKVHVGVSMGQSGTAVAVEASDLVLLDDNFATIVEAVEEGRSVFRNVQRFIAFLFSGNFGVVLAMFAGTILAGLFDIRYDGQILLPLTAAQILWMNLVTDGAPALAFALGRGSDQAMEEPPRDPGSPILEPKIWLFVAVTGTALAALFLLILDLLYAGGIWSLRTEDHSYARSAAFFTLVTARLFNALNFLDLEQGLLKTGLRSSLWVPIAATVSWLLTLGILYQPWLAKVFALTPIAVSHAAILTAASAAVMLGAGSVFKIFRARNVDLRLKS